MRYNLQGFETSTLTIQYFLMCMAKHPEIQTKCQLEVDQIFEANPTAWNNGTVGMESIQGGLKYLERCILETLRLYPPAYLQTRHISAPLDIEYKGNTVRIPSNTAILSCNYWLHRNPDNFSHPTKFDPDRFLPEEVAKRHAYVYMPFSAGPRNCLGQKLAMLQVKTMAAYLLRRFEFSSPESIDEIPLVPYILLAPQRNYRFFLKKRSYVNAF